MTTSLPEVLNSFRSFREPRDGFGATPFRLACWLDEPASAAEVHAAWPGDTVPDELAQAWSISRQARLFQDVDYGQWGLVLLSPGDAATRTAQERSNRPEQWLDDDIVIGEFLGDQDLVVLAPSESTDRRIVISLPLDDRPGWYGAAADLADFLSRYRDTSGDKYWE